jgi:hypothetical protein
MVFARTPWIAISAVLSCALANSGLGEDATNFGSGKLHETTNVGGHGKDPPTVGLSFEPIMEGTGHSIEAAEFVESIQSGNPDCDEPAKADVDCDDSARNDSESAKFPRAYQIPGTDFWWKFGGYIKADFIHDFEPAGEEDRFVPITIPTDGFGGQNTLLQAKATRLNLDVRTPSDCGIARGFVEGDFFTDDNRFRLRHAYAEVGHLLAGQTWTAFTDPDAIPRTLDFESPIAFITLRQAQFRWTQPIGDSLTWTTSIEDPNTTADDVVFATIPGQTEQPLPDLITRLKYNNDVVEWLVAGLFRDLAYRPFAGPAQEDFGWAVNLVGIFYPTENDKIIAQLIYGDGLGRYRSGSDLGLETSTTLDAVTHIGSCFALTHNWTKKLSSTGVYSCALRRNTAADPGNIPHFSQYTAVNLIWEFIDNTTIGIEYLYGTNETDDDAFGFANRIQASVQYNFP